MHQTLKPNALRVAAVALFGTAAALATAPTAEAQGRSNPGRYVTGDFHNHTTCSDGQISVQRLVNRSVDTYGLDWFILADHGGSGTRNCTLPDDLQTATDSGVDALFPFVEGQGPATTWADSGQGGRIIANPPSTTTMRRWQTIAEYHYPVAEAMSRAKRKPIWVGTEQVVPGHEHADVVVNDGQLINDGRPVVGSPSGNAEAMAQWEYCFDRADTDTSRGGPSRQWDCTVPGGTRNELLDATGRKLVGAENNGSSGHQKTVEGIRWLQAFHPNSSFYVPAHVERAGVFNPAGNNGFNIEHFRDFNNAGPSVAFGFEGGPGHGASGSTTNPASLSGRSYSVNAPGRGTYGQAGYYMAKLGGVWDTLLGEGRNFWIFNNSDYHNRGAFGPDDPRTTNDQFPGEFNDTYVLARNGRRALSTQDVVDGMRSGNAWYVNGDLIDRLAFVACRARGRNKLLGRNLFERQIARAAEAGEGFENNECVGMGGKLVIDRGDDVFVHMILRDPAGTNLAPYTFPNPSLARIGINVPHNAPVLDHVDLINGRVTGYISPDDPRYAGEAPGGAANRLNADGTPIPDSPNTINPSTYVMRTFSRSNWEVDGNGFTRMFQRISDVSASQYLRLRGTNMPAGTPNETDGRGNPLVDYLAHDTVFFPQDFDARCSDPAQAPNIVNCASHLLNQVDPATGRTGKRIDLDVEAWTDLWFYSNPIYIEVRGGTVVAGVN